MHSVTTKKAALAALLVLAALLSIFAVGKRASDPAYHQASIDALEEKIRDMQDMAATLKDLVHSCRGDHRAECPILERLETDLPGEDLSLRPRKGAI